MSLADKEQMLELKEKDFSTLSAEDKKKLADLEDKAMKTKPELTIKDKEDLKALKEKDIT